jgi:hypothetical protein
MSQQCERAAHAAGWFRWFGFWLHIAPWADDYERPPYFIGTACELCLSQGLSTGEGL